ncbi:hypothetical protein K491DRAFT_688933 [Lophiostoma macrostomum CBS 122681]|uniref:Uncharacterized protein n=1 Tax=Lophiostoma macrostomum CBS 122681 TaxID=1314788 RepID=A0A6A6TKV1_9PLEO|nr:hypothetical protein K491DRAFT_688933 [Lophiostoma macrostomum CBS 122681]
MGTFSHRFLATRLGGAEIHCVCSSVTSESNPLYHTTRPHSAGLPTSLTRVWCNLAADAL